MHFDLKQSARIVTACILVTIFAVPPSLLAQTHVVSPADLQKEALTATQARQQNLQKVKQFFSSEKAQKALKANPSISTEIGQRLFPADEAQLIAGLIERDAPFYDAEISQDAVDGLMKFAKGYGLIKDAVPYQDLVATQFSHLWKE